MSADRLRVHVRAPIGNVVDVYEGATPREILDALARVALPDDVEFRVEDPRFGMPEWTAWRAFWRRALGAPWVRPSRLTPSLVFRRTAFPT